MLAGRLSENAGDHVTLVEAGPRSASGRPATSTTSPHPGAVWDDLVVTDGSGARHGGTRRAAASADRAAVNGGLLAHTHDDPLLPAVQIPGEAPHPSQLGLIDRALLAAAGDATVALLARRAGRPVSAADAYLTPACRTQQPRRRHRARSSTASGSPSRRAIGVVLAGGDVIGADRVVVAAGALFSPALLLRSGVDTPGLGDGLRDHVGRVIELTLRHAGDSEPRGLVTGALLRRGAVEVVTMNHLGRSLPGRAALLVGLLSNQRRGTVRLPPDRPDDPAAPPRVDFGTLGAADMVRLAAGMTMAHELLAAAAVHRCRRRRQGRRGVRRLRPRHLDVCHRHRRRRAWCGPRLRRAVRVRRLGAPEPAAVWPVPPRRPPRRAPRPRLAPRC